MKDTDYAFAVARIRSNESKLLSSSELNAVISAPTYKEAVNLLNEKGYEIKSTDYSQALELRASRYFTLVREVLPDQKLFESLLIKNDFHNLKIVLKSFFLEQNFDRLFEYPSVYSPEEIKNCVFSGKFDSLPECMISACKKAYSVLSKTKYAQLSDCITDRFSMEETVKAAEKSGEHLLRDIAHKETACADIKILYRCILTGKDRDFMNEAVAECNGFCKKDIISAALGGTEPFFEFLLHTEYADTVDALKTGTAEFERLCDNKVMSLLADTKTEVFGISPIVAFYYAVQTEIKNIRIILSAKLNGLSEESVRARVRDSFV